MWSFWCYTPRDPRVVFWQWLLIRSVVIQCAYPWRELSIILKKSCQSFSRMKSWVSPRVRTNQSHLLWWLSVFGAQMLLVGVMILSIRDSWCWYHQDMKTNCSSFQFLFLIFAVSRNSTLKWYYGSLVFNFLGLLCFVSMKKSSFLDNKFSCFFGMSFLCVLLNVKLLMLYF